MTINFEMTAEAAQTRQLEDDVLQLKQEKERFLTAIKDVRRPLPARRLTDIREDLEIAEARLEEAKELETAALDRYPSEEDVRALLAPTRESLSQGFKDVGAAATALREAVSTYLASVTTYDETVRDARRSLKSIGIPDEGTVLDEEPIEVTHRSVEFDGVRFGTIGDKHAVAYVFLAAGMEKALRERPFPGWSTYSEAYRKRNPVKFHYWAAGNR